MALVNGDDVCMILDSDLSVVVALSDSGIDILVVCLIKCFASSLFPKWLQTVEESKIIVLGTRSPILDKH